MGFSKTKVYSQNTQQGKTAESLSNVMIVLSCSRLENYLSAKKTIAQAWITFAWFARKTFQAETVWSCTKFKFIPALNVKKTFAVFIYLKTHMVKCHSSGPLKCSTCDQSYTTLGRLNNHKKIHSKSKPFICDCGKAFKSHHNMKRHNFTHSESNKHFCHVCDKNTCELYSLKLISSFIK